MLPEDLIEYGLIPEFIGRLPVVSAIHQLTRDDLITILTEPRNALTRQFQRFFEFDDIELVFADDSLGAIADKALERETGARGLRSILEETLLDVQFELPSRRDVTKCVVTKETIEGGRTPTLVTEAAPRRHRAPTSSKSPPSAGRLARHHPLVEHLGRHRHRVQEALRVLAADVAQAGRLRRATRPRLRSPCRPELAAGRIAAVRGGAICRRRRGSRRRPGG